jgi:protocatechuate 3,4-dioxygenase beta subunit
LRRVRITLSAPELGTVNRTASTGLDGRFEIKELPPGRYTVRVQRGGYLTLQYGQRRPLEPGKPLQLADKQVVDNLDFTLPRMGTIAGRVTDELGEPISGVSVFALRSVWFEGRRRMAPAVGNVVTDDEGEFRLQGVNPGRYLVMAVSNETWTVASANAESVVGYAPTYHPGTANVAEARTVSVDIGQRVTNVDLALVPGRTARISGVARDGQGRPLRDVTLEQSFRGPNGASFRSAGNAIVAADGTFTLRSVPPGEYALRGSSPGSDESARLPIVVTGDDLDGVNLTAAPGWRLSGHVITDTGTAPPIPRDRLRIGGRLLTWPTGLASPGARNAMDDVVKDDWTFQSGPLFGPVQIRVSGLPEGWAVRAIYHNGRDITDDTLEFSTGEDLQNVQVTITDKVTTVAGQLLDAKGTPLVDGTVIVFAEDSQKWMDGSRWVRSVRPDQAGHYQLRGLPAGAYLAIALDYVEDGTWNDAVYLETLRARTKRFFLDEAGSHTLTLNVIKP